MLMTTKLISSVLLSPLFFLPSSTCLFSMFLQAWSISKVARSLKNSWHSIPSPCIVLSFSLISINSQVLRPELEQSMFSGFLGHPRSNTSAILISNFTFRIWFQCDDFSPFPFPLPSDISPQTSISHSLIHFPYCYNWCQVRTKPGSRNSVLISLHGRHWVISCCLPGNALSREAGIGGGTKTLTQELWFVMKVFQAAF